MGKVGTIIKGNLGAEIIKGTTDAVASLAKGALEVGTNFETAMSQVAATMGITTTEIKNGSKEYDMLSAKAKEMGSTTKYTATEAAEGLNILAMSGLSAEEACGGIADVMYLAGAGAMSLEEAATYTTGAVKGFGDSMDNASKYTDIMAAGATMANTDVKALGAALSGASATANAYNQSVESTSVALLRLAEQNVTGQEAATALSRVMADLYTPTAKASKALEELGISTYDAQGNARDLNEVVDELNDALKGMSDEEKLAYESTIFTTYGMKGFQKMTVSTTETVNKFRDGIANAAGSAMQQFETQNDNLAGKLAILQSALEGLGLAIYEIFGDELKDAVEGATDVIDRISESVKDGKLGDSLERLSKSFGEFLQTALEFGENALPLIVDGMSWLLENIGSIAAGWLTYKGIMLGAEAATLATKIATEGLITALELNPLGIVATAAGLAVTAMVSLAGMTKGVSSEMRELGDETRKVVESSEKLVGSSDKMVSDFRAESEYVADLTQKLKENQEVLKKNAEAKIVDRDLIEETQGIVDRLNATVEGLNITLDEETGIIKDGTDAWEKYIQTQMKRAQLAAITEKIKDITKQRVDNEMQLIQAEKGLTDAQKTALENANKYAEIQTHLNDVTSDEADILAQRTEAMQGASHEQVVAFQQAENLVFATEELNEQEELLNEYIKENIGDIEDYSEATENAATASEEFSEATDDVSEALQQEKEELQATLQNSISLFDDFTEATKVSKEEIIKNFEEQVSAMEDWASNMQILADRGINEGILRDLAEMGPASAGYIQGLLDMTGPELEHLNEMFVNSFKITGEAADQIVNDYYNVGNNAQQRFVDGEWQIVESGNQEKLSQEVVDQLMNSPAWNYMGEEARKKVLDASGQMLDEAQSDPNIEQLAPTIVENLMNSPAWNLMGENARQKVLEAAGQMGDQASSFQEAGTKDGDAAVKGTSDALTKGQEQINSAAKDMAEGITSAIEDEIGFANGNSSKALEYGESISRSLGEGIKKNTGTAQNAATSLAMQVKTAVQNGTAKSYFEAMGRNVSGGLASGINSGAGEAKTAASSLATSVKSTVQEGLPQSAFAEIGKNVGAGLAQGIEAGKSEAINAATKLAEETIAAAKAKLQIHSPSKVFEEIGTFCVTGFNKGLDSMSVEDTIGRNIDNTLSNMVANAQGGGGGITQNITINSRAMSPDEVAREMRLEAKYGLMGGVTVE